MMSRAYTELYPPQDDTSNYVKLLISLGAVIVGKTKMTSFACYDEPTDQWINFMCPTNPRNDRYQSPAGSSTGAAASRAGYPWLDQSIGVDGMLFITALYGGIGRFSQP
jgi:Asp-tRNA(Asn)/Glu-tRNA(Gln) amidotransferase A subunit family amidase